MAFGLRVANSDAELHCIAAKDLDAIRDNILEGENKFLDLFEGLAELKTPSVGSKYIEFYTPKGVKKILLAGYSNVKTWEKILGKPIECFLIDEINIANKTFVHESIARQFSFENPITFGTLNGDDPEHFVYTDYINHSTDMFPEDTPQSTIDDMVRFDKRDGYYYAFWGLDDHPTMTVKKKKAIMEAFPVGSFYYQTKVLGVRGVQEGALYANLITREHYVDWEHVNISAITRCEIGIDIGGNANTVYTLVGYTNQFARAIVIDRVAFNKPDHDMMIDKFNEFIKEWYPILGSKINTVWVETATGGDIFRRTLRKKIVYPIRVEGCKKLTIEARVVLKEQLLHRKRLLFVRDFGAMEVASALRKIKTDGKGGVLDENKPENDDNDALDYALTPHMNKLSEFEG